VPDEECHGPHKGGCGKLIEIQISTSEYLIHTGSVNEESCEDGFEHDTVNHDHINLGEDKRFPLTLTTEDIRPLHENDSNEESRLGVEESFSSITSILMGNR